MTDPEPGTSAARLFELLPAVYRLRDAETGGVLAELVGVLADQVDVLSEELAQFYDDQFIDTAAAWAAPYIGEVVGYRPIHDVAPNVASPRAEVANTVGYRRRKGTAAVIEQVAADVTGWSARVVESFETLVTTQYMNHPRPLAQASPDLHDHATLGRIRTQGGAFDDLARTADVRRVDAAKPARPGRYGIRKIAIFLWRAEAVTVTRSPLVHHGESRRFRFDPLGTDLQLFAVPRVETEISHLAEPPDVPQPLGRRWSAGHASGIYGVPGGRARRSLLLERQKDRNAPVVVLPGVIRFSDLSDAPGGGGAWAHEPSGDTVAIDPVLGRVYLGTALPADERLLGTFAVGMAVPVGAGNTSPLKKKTPSPTVDVSAGDNLQPILDGIKAGGTVRIVDADRYQNALTISTLRGPQDEPDAQVRLAAADHARPTIIADEVRLDMAPRTEVVLDGLTISGGAVVLDEVGDTEPRTIVIRNSTLVPGGSRTPGGGPAHSERASLSVLDPSAVVIIERSVVGPVVAVEGATVRVVDSVVDASARTAVAVCGRDGTVGLRTVSAPADLEVGDGMAPAGDVDLSASTIVGGIRCVRLDASNSLLVAALAAGDPRPAAIFAERKQIGCVRYSYIPDGSRTGRRFHCAPEPGDPLGVRIATKPRFDSLRFGDAAYLRLNAGTDDRLRRGADDESEMGVTHRLFAPQREANLSIRLDEYLRLGLSAGWFYAT
jgi:hypothetical protein